MFQIWKYHPRVCHKTFLKFTEAMNVVSLIKQLRMTLFRNLGKNSMFNCTSKVYSVSGYTTYSILNL